MDSGVFTRALIIELPVKTLCALSLVLFSACDAKADIVYLKTGGVLRVDVDSDLFLAELHLGGYVRGRLHERVTTYAATGPMVMYGSHDINDDNVHVSPLGTVVITESDSSDINIGYYARAGIDFEFQQNQFMGLGIRYMSTELDFDKTVGSLDIKGAQYVLTFSARL